MRTIMVYAMAAMLIVLSIEALWVHSRADVLERKLAVANALLDSRAPGDQPHELSAT